MLQSIAIQVAIVKNYIVGLNKLSISINLN